jgi:hypothetical protein
MSDWLNELNGARFSEATLGHSFNDLTDLTNLTFRTINTQTGENK